MSVLHLWLKVLYTVYSQVCVIYSMSADECVYDEVFILTLGWRLFIMFCDFLPNVFLPKS